MRDYWLTQDLLKAAGFGIIAMALLGIGLALWLPKKWWGKLIALGVVVFAISIPLRQGVQEIKDEQTKADDYQERYARAKALFDERCKTAGEKIYRTVDNVEGVLLLKVRPEYQDGVGSDAMYPGAALIQESGGDGYIASFLRYERLLPPSQVGSRQVSDRPTSLLGYRFVEVVAPNDGKRYRFTKVYGPANLPPAEYMGKPALNKLVTTGVPPRYAVTYEDIVDPEDRKHWVAGTVLTVLDTKTNEVIAQRTSYLFETGLGNTDGGRNPWGWASSSAPGCPRTVDILGTTTRFFVDQVLKPIQAE